jgi:glycosyltransferase involved in cell wall biosynthesis
MIRPGLPPGIATARSSPFDQQVPPPDQSCTFVLPASNEALSLGRVIDEIVHHAPQAGLSPITILVIDDGSTDDTWSTTTAAATRHPGIVRGLRLRRNFGKSTALATGFAHCETELVATLDTDGQDDPSALLDLRNALDTGLDLVTGWKASRQDPWSRRLASRIFNTVVGVCTGLSLRDMNCGFKLMRVELAREFVEQLTSEMHRFLPVLAHSHGFRVGEVIVPHHPRQHGQSHFGWERFPRGAFDLLTVLANSHYGRRPEHLFGWLGLLSGGSGIAILSYLTVLWWQGQRPIGTRPLFSMGILLVVVGIQFFSLGFLAGLIRKNTASAPRRWPIADRL